MSFFCNSCVVDGGPVSSAQGLATIFAAIPHVRGLGRVPPWLALAAPACLMAALGFARRWVGDDGARSALGCGALAAELRRATTEPSRWGRFWQNVLRAPFFRRLRVPASTWQAKRQFCGPAQRKGSA